MVAVTQTLSTWGGNFYVSKGLGFLYNDHFRGGRGGTGYGSMLPLMRSSSTSVPTLVFAPDAGGFTPRLAVGAAGNAWIPASVYDIILNVVDGGMGAQRAIEAPRFLIGNAPGGGSRVQIEDRIPRTVLRDLEARGHTFAKVGRKGEVKYRLRGGRPGQHGEGHRRRRRGAAPITRGGEMTVRLQHSTISISPPPHFLSRGGIAQRPRLSLTPNIARRGSMNTFG